MNMPLRMHDFLQALRLRWSAETVFILWLFTPLLIINHFTKDFKAVFYILPVLTWAYVLLHQYFAKPFRTLPLDPYLLRIIPFYLVICAIALFFNPIETHWFTVARDIIIITGPLFIFMLPLSFKHNHIRLLLLISMFCYLIWIKFDVDFVFLKSLFKSNFDMDHEYDYGTVVGLFLLYFAYKRDYKFFLISVLYLMFANKRATYLGLLPAILFFIGIIQFCKLEDRPKWLLFVLFAYYILFFVVSINLPLIAEVFLKLTDKQYIKVDSFLTGRVVMIKELTPELYNRGFFNYIFGNGPGQADYYLLKVIKHPIYNFKIKPINPHNDFLKLHYDYGLLSVCLYFFVMYYMYVRSKVGILIFLYVVPLFLIENTLIYYVNLILACIIARVNVGNDASSYPTLARHG